MSEFFYVMGKALSGELSSMETGLVNAISVISGEWKGDNERMCAMESHVYTSSRAQIKDC